VGVFGVADGTAPSTSITGAQIWSESTGLKIMGSGATNVVTIPKTTGTAYVSTGTDVALADGGTGASLTDPNADRIMFWDDSAGSIDWLTAGTGLTISGTTISASGAAANPSSLNIVTADGTVGNTTTEGNLYSYSVAGGTLGTNGLFTVEGFISILQNRGSTSTSTLRIKYGATTLFTHSLSMTSSATRRWYYVRIWLKGDTATNAQRAVILSTSPAGLTTMTGAASMAGDEATSAEDSTAAKTFAITIQHDATNSSYTASARFTRNINTPAV
jgi:hypothetical protein